MSMMKIEAIVREEKMEDVKAALKDEGVHGMTIYQVMGCGNQGGYTEYVRGNEVDVNVLPKIKFEVIVSNETVAKNVIDTIAKAAHTGHNGDGKIIAYELSSCIRIRTGEEGTNAV